MNLQVHDTSSPRGFSVSLGDPFTVRMAREGEYLIHPRLSHLGDGSLVLMMSPDRDVQVPHGVEGVYIEVSATP